MENNVSELDIFEDSWFLDFSGEYGDVDSLLNEDELLDLQMRIQDCMMQKKMAKN